MEKCNKEATRFYEEGMQFVLGHYADMIIEKINDVDISQKPKNITDHVYMTSRDEFYISSLALMLAVLNDDYNMGTNQKNTGRLDTLMEYCTNEWVKIQLDPDGHSADAYVKKTRDKTGIKL